MAALFLGLLCAALMAAIVGLIIAMTGNIQQLQGCRSSQANLSVSVGEREVLERELHKHLTNVFKDKTELEAKCHHLQTVKSQLEANCSATAEERDELQRQVTKLDKKKTGLEAMSHQLQTEKSQLEAKCSATAEERDELQRQVTKLESMMEIKKHAVDVVLDPDTAHPNLVISRDGKTVWLGNKQQNLPNIPKRFNAVPCVLAKDGISGGKLYYEVLVRQKLCWDIGVARESINRKGQINYTTKNGYWIVMRRGNEFYAPESRAVPVYLSVKPEKVGVFVDYDAGLVSFYDADRWNNIHSYTSASFSGKLYPFLSTCAIPNEVPLIISPVQI